MNIKKNLIHKFCYCTFFTYFKHWLNIWIVWIFLNGKLKIHPIIIWKLFNGFLFRWLKVFITNIWFQASKFARWIQMATQINFHPFFFHSNLISFPFGWKFIFWSESNWNWSFFSIISGKKFIIRIRNFIYHFCWFICLVCPIEFHNEN